MLLSAARGLLASSAAAADLDLALGETEAALREAVAELEREGGDPPGRRGRAFWK